MTASTRAHSLPHPLRICHLITDLEIGGAERTLVNLVTRMDRTQFYNDVITLIDPGPMAKLLTAAGVPVVSLGMRRGRPNIWALLSLVRRLRATKPAILQTWLYHADLMGTVAAWMVRPEFLLWNVRCTDVTGFSVEKSTRWLVRTLAFLSSIPDAVVVNSNRGQRDHQTVGYRAKRWVQIPNGVDLRHFRPRLAEQAALRARFGLRANVATIGLVARFHPMKDVGTFLRASASLVKTHAATQFVLCGDGFDVENSALTQMIASLGLNDHVVLLGRRTDVALVYPALDVFTLCSAYGEGFPNALCEAMACGIACVATDVGDSADILGESGVIVPTRNPEALASAWKMLLSRGTQNFGKLAHARVTSCYSIERMCGHYQSLYQSLVGYEADGASFRHAGDTKSALRDS
jgi:glycosyltransferase involved in cell wall biosynthesis